MEHLQSDIHEIDYRQNDGIEVFLYWHKEANILSLALTDHKKDFSTEFVVPNDKAREAFLHPFAWMPTQSIEN